MPSHWLYALWSIFFQWGLYGGKNMLLIFLSVMQLHPVGLCITCAHQNTFGFLDNNIFWVGRKMNHCKIHFSFVHWVYFNICKLYIAKPRISCKISSWYIFFLSFTVIWVLSGSKIYWLEATALPSGIIDPCTDPEATICLFENFPHWNEKNEYSAFLSGFNCRSQSCCCWMSASVKESAIVTISGNRVTRNSACMHTQLSARH